MSKRCSRCGEVKSESLFYGDSRARDGLQSACKQCHQKANKWDKLNPEGRAKAVRKYNETHRDKVNQSIRNGWNKYPEKQRARLIVGKAIQQGKLVRKQCQVCGALKTEAHHEDYSKPLEVLWLCRKHHAEVHKNLGNENEED